MTVFKTSSGRWRAQHNRRSLGTFRTKTEARKAEAEHLAGLRPDPTRISVEQWRTIWLGQLDVRESTMRHYVERTNGFVREFGDRPLGSITATEAVTWAAGAKTTVPTLGQMFRAAERQDVIPKSPFGTVRRQKYRRELVDGVISAAELEQLEAAAASMQVSSLGPVMRSMVTVAAWTGIRPGELFALDPVHVLGDRLLIAGSVDSKTGTVGLTKNGRQRTVVLPPPAQTSIAELAEAKRFHFGARTDALPLFPNLRGSRWRQSGWLYHWKTIRQGVRPGMDFYELRHFAATRLLEAGLSKEDVAHQLGHVDGGELVMKTYGRPAPEHAEQRIAAAMARIEAQAKTPASAAGGG